RDEEIDRIIQILSRRTKNNPVLIGDLGVGKTSVVEGLAQKIVSNEVPETLSNKRVMTIDMGKVVAGTKYRDEFEDSLNKVMEEICNAENVIIFIDELNILIDEGVIKRVIYESTL